MMSYKAELKILSLGVPQELSTGIRFMEQGNNPESIYFLKRGKVKIHGPHVNRTTHDQEFFGLHEVVNKSRYQQEITTLADSYLVKIPAQALLNLFEEDAEVRRYLMLQLCRSMDMAEKEFE